jgi:putative acetyltransferase
VIVRLEEQGDRDASLEIERRAFRQGDEPEIVVSVRDEEGSFALVAEEYGALVGHVQLSRAWVGESAVLALGPIGVEPDHQRRGIGQALVEAALIQAAGRGEIAVILLGDPAYYGRLGFLPAAVFGLRNPFTGTTPDGFVIAEEDFMLAPLADGAQELVGDVRWHPAFGGG